MVVAAAATASAGGAPLLAAVSWVALLFLLLLVLFAVADCDLGLYLRGPAPPDAFRGKVVWITGASQGLGEALARKLAARGARLVLTSRSREGLEAVARALPPAADENGGGGGGASPCAAAFVLPLDLAAATQEEFERAAARADQAFGGAGVDVLLHVAGGSQHALAEETSDAVAGAVFALNALGPIKLTRAALPYLTGAKGGGAGGGGGSGADAAAAAAAATATAGAKDGGAVDGSGGHREEQRQQQEQERRLRPRRVVAVCSAAAVCPSPGECVYSGAKAALLAYLRSLASEVADSPLRVTIALPGPIATGTEEGKPRVIFGALGLQAPPAPGAPKRSKKGRMDPGRCADLVLAAAAYGRDEAWLSRHPVLLLMHAMQFFPSLGRALMRVVGPKRARGMHTGESSGYDVRALLFGGRGGRGAAAAARKVT